MEGTVIIIDEFLAGIIINHDHRNQKSKILPAWALGQKSLNLDDHIKKTL